MKILILSTANKIRRTRGLWRELGKFAEVELEILGEGRFPNLKHVSGNVDALSYDRIVVDNNLRRMGRDYRSLRKIPNAVIFEFDFCHNYLPESAFFGKGESLLKTLPPHRLIISSVYMKNDLKSKGFDVGYSPKGYSPDIIHDLQVARDIELGFIGRVKHRSYAPRRVLLDRLRAEVGLQAFRTDEGAEYNQMLHRIRIFVCPDLHFPEFMIKNYEAMAAGCALVTARQIDEELRCLGFEDMRNVVLFGSYEEMLEKVARLRRDPALVASIAEAGQRLAKSRHTWECRAEGLHQMLQPPLRQPPQLTWRDRWNLLALNLKRRKAWSSE